MYPLRNDGKPRDGWVWEADFAFVDFNRAAEEIEHVKKEDILGRSVLEVFPGVRDLGLFDVFPRVYQTGEAEQHPVSIYWDAHTTS
ncbi:MAG: PAS domain-containing protein [Planctomycetes bacterium]|nr:PAS domain-containing protein [Planctomycetota bacterium]